MTDREIDTMNTSAIDLICCSLGAMLMIMLAVATLVRTQAERQAATASDLAADPAEGSNVSPDDGLFRPPPVPLLVALTWDRPPQSPLELTAFPPEFAATGPGWQVLKGLTKQQGLVIVGKDTYVGFMDRRSGRAKPSVRLVVPKGGRSAAADAELLRLSRPGAARPLWSKDPPAKFWRFRVRYPEPTAGAGAPLAGVNSALEPLQLTAGPSLSGNESDEPLKAVWSADAVQGARAALFNSPAGNRHDAALKLAAAVDKELAAANRRRPDDPLDWVRLIDTADRFAPPAEVKLLAAVRAYQEKFAGTDPEAAGPVAVALTIEAFGRPARRCVPVKVGSDQLSPGDDADFRHPDAPPAP